MVYGSEVQQNDSSKGPETSMDDGEKKERVWESPWSTDEIRKNGGKWTLAGDVGLLNHLHDFSQKLISRTHEMGKVVDSLVHKSKVAGAKVNNVINDFQMLSNLQFVENRVYDEEVQEPEPIAPKEFQPKTKEQREAEMLPRVIQALELGASVLEKAFERIEVDETSESEDEDDEDEISRGRTILEPKDLYEHRPLPYVIGTVQFHNDDYAGLRNTVDDEPSVETTQEENMYSSTSSSATSSTESEEEDEVAESFPSKQPLPAKHRDTIMSDTTMNTKHSDSESSDLFGEEEEINGYVSSSPADKAKPEVNGVSGARNPLMDELLQKAAKPVPSAARERPETIQSSGVNKGSSENDDLFGGSGDGFQDEDSPFRKTTGLFSSNVIFGTGKDDNKSDDEGDLFGDREESESFQKKPAPVSKVQVLPSPPISKGRNSYEDEDDLFAEGIAKPMERKPAPIAKVQVLPPPVPRMPSDDDDDDDDDDLFGKKQKSKPLERKPAPIAKVQVLPTKEIRKTDGKTGGSKVVKQPVLFGDEDDDEESDLFSSFPSQKSTSTKNVSSVSDMQSNKIPEKSTPSPSISERSSRSLFDASKEPSRSASLFGDDSDSEELFTTSKKTSDQKGFSFSFSADAGGEDDGFDLFGNKSTSKQAKAAETSSGEKNPPQKAPASLFEESDSFDLFSHATEPKPKSDNLGATKTEGRAQLPLPTQSEKNPSTSLFEESDRFDLFSPVDKNKQQKPKPADLKVGDKAQEVSKKPPVSILDQEEATQKTSPVKVPAQPQKKTPIPVMSHQSSSENVSKVVPTSSTKDVVDAVVSFDKPLDAGSTLSAINKSRAKIQVKRKKPTRKGRQARMSSDSDFGTDNETPNAVSSVKPMASADSEMFAGASTSNAGPSPPIPATTHKQKETDKRNLMSQLISEAKSSKVLKQNVVSKVVDNKENDDYENDDLFSSRVFGGKSKATDSDFSVLSPTPKEPDKVPVKDSSEIKGPKPEASSLLLSDSTSDEDLFSASAFKDFRNSLSKNSVFEEDDDDIFKSSENKDNLSRHSSEALGEANDDIFAGIEKEKYEMFPTQVFDDDDDDDDDIFSNVITTSSKKEAPREKPKPSKKSQDDLFEDPLGVA